MDDELLTIGAFARLTGLTAGALRHYDEERVLVPADVDAATGYRRYRTDQVPMARAIAALRELELSVPAIRALLQADDPSRRASILGDELTRLEARTARLQRAVHRLGMLAKANVPATNGRAVSRQPSPSSRPTTSPGTSLRVKEITVPTPPPLPSLPADTHRALGRGLYNRCWDLMGVEDRTTDQDDELLATAYASAWHWLQVGHRANRARSEWMCSRVNAVLGHPEAALRHANRCRSIVAEGGDGFEDWDTAGAFEAMARALAAAGDLAGAADWKARAMAALDAIRNPKDRAPIEGDLATIPV